MCTGSALWSKVEMLVSTDPKENEPYFAQIFGRNLDYILIKSRPVYI